MYVGIARARATLGVSTLKRRKRGREMVAGVPSRFVAEMKLHEAPGRRRSARKAEGVACAAAERARLAASAARRRPRPGLIAEAATCP